MKTPLQTAAILTLIGGCQHTGSDKDLSPHVPTSDHREADSGTDTVEDNSGTPEAPAGLRVCRSVDGYDTTILQVADTTDGLLRMEVSYGGGCEAHDFELCWPEQAFLESEPVQVALELLHTGIPDPCYASIVEEIQLDVTPMADAWRDAYRSDSGEMLLLVDGHPSMYRF